MSHSLPPERNAMETLERESQRLASLLVLGLDADPGNPIAQLEELEQLVVSLSENAAALALTGLLSQTASILSLMSALRTGPPSQGDEVWRQIEPQLAPLYESLTQQLGTLKAATRTESSALADSLVGGSEVDPPETRDEIPAEPGSAYGLAGDLELLREFLVEASGHLEAIESGALALEDEPNNRETLNLLFRAFHSIKGLAGFLEIDAIQHTAHELENLLDMARDGALRISRPAIDLILDTHSYLSEALGQVAARVEGTAAGSVEENPALLQRIARFQLDAVTAPATATPVPPPGSGAHEESTESAAPMEASQTPDRKHAPIAADVALPLPAGSDGATERGLSASRTSAAGAVVKVDTEKLDYLVDMVGELVIAQSMVRNDPLFTSSQNARLLKNMAQMTRVTAEVQRVAMSMRMVPIKGLFQRMSRLSRDLARKYDKQVRVELEGEETELDRTLIEQLADPMMHMVRNAIDHGLETSAERLAAGKPAEGLIRLLAVHQSGSILISIADNGRGLDRRRILEKARSRGLVHENAALTDAQIDQLIFEPGFSTAAVVSDLSGRGVGMDVVRRNIQQLRGRVEVHSVSGQGTTMTMKLPLTLAIIDGLVVGARGERFIIPLFSVREMFRADAGAITHVQGQEEVLQVRGVILPVVRLRRRLGLKEDGDPQAATLCLVVESARSTYCLLVDEFVGKQEVVIKSLGEQFADVPGIAAGAILGDGTVGLILDMEGIFEGTCTR